MECKDVIKRIPELALDELDVEVRRDVTAHLDACAACRAERDGQERALGAMRGLVVETSEHRRHDAIAAMVSVRDELVERAIMKRPSVWPLRVITAVAALLVIGAIGYVVAQPDHTWRVVSGTATPSDVVRPSESVVANGPVVLESSRGRIELAPLTKVTVMSRSRVQLLQGELRVESKHELTVTNPWGDRIIVRDGAAVVASDLRAIADPPREMGDRLRVRVDRGQAVMRGARGELLLEAGQKSRLDSNGQPAN